ncbi:unnamed protein product [Dovyalis caffra]|uniref:Uncharacterized protein n=1 Tax=Dovyalis caffra TaxID=77055 RepID=A0AAV1RFF8_9ROSI|nr:unnamed protein product [Dovyalis caffra]
MDVFIPEEYVMRRRIEKRRAGVAGKMQEESRNRNIEEKKVQPSSFRLENDFLIDSTALSENRCITQAVRMAEWSKAPDSSSGPRERAWVQIPLLTIK